MAKARKKRTGAMLIWGVEAVLRKDFRKRCLDKGISMQRAIKGLMEEFVKRA